MCNPNYLANAIETVLTLDLPEHLIPLAISDLAKFNAGFDCDSGFSSWAEGVFDFHSLK